jgi:hypothetical protein
MSLHEGVCGGLEVYLAHFLLTHGGEVSCQLHALSALLLGGLFSTHWLGCSLIHRASLHALEETSLSLLGFET